MGIAFGNSHAFLLLSAQQFDMNRGAEGLGNPSKHAQGMAFVGRRFQSADLLLGRAHPFGKLLLRKAGFLSQGGQFQRDIPCFPGFFEAFGKTLILELFLKILIEICFSFHCGCLTNQSRFLSRAVFRSLSDISLPLLRMA